MSGKSSGHRTRSFIRANPRVVRNKSFSHVRLRGANPQRQHSYLFSVKQMVEPNGKESYLRKLAGILKLSSLQKLGEGVYGLVGQARITDANVVSQFASKLVARVGKVSPPSGAVVAVKIATLDPKHDFVQPGVANLLPYIRENRAHYHLITSCASVSGVKLCGASVVPGFYFSGFDLENGVYVTFMEPVVGVPLSKIGDLTAIRYASVERTLVTLWANGVAHTDAHSNNLFIRKNNRVVALDFGFAVNLPPGSRPKSLRQALNPNWQYAMIKAYTNRVVHQRGFSGSHADAKKLYQMRERVVDPQNLAAARRAVWAHNRDLAYVR